VNDAPARRFALDQNYPNPFNPSTSIHYVLPRSSKVSLRVYDQRGRLVRALVDGVEQAGEKTVVWDGRSADGAKVSSGVYLYQLKAGDLVEQHKMTLVK
jgi:flagellar hook assembly protein FlgD